MIDIVDLMTAGRDPHDGRERSIMDWSDSELKLANKTINKAIARAIKHQKSLVEWVLGYELTEKSIPTARVEIYWAVKTAAEHVRAKGLPRTLSQAMELANEAPHNVQIVANDRGHQVLVTSHNNGHTRFTSVQPFKLLNSGIKNNTRAQGN